MKSVAVLSFSSLAAAWCNYGTALHPRHSNLARRADGEFGYDELEGPLDWHGLSDDNSLCATGSNQSPINVYPGTTPTTGGSSINFTADNAASGAEFENLGHGVQAYATGSIDVGGTSYALQQFHFHTPSEHRIGSEYYPGEVHFVFQAEDDSLSVVGIPLEIAGPDDSASPLITAVLGSVGQIPNSGDTTTTDSLDFSDIAEHIASTQLYQYSGSLTTPPCDEDVAWNLVAQPLFIDVGTFRQVKSIVKFNSRYTQNSPGQINLLDNARNVLNG